MNGRKAKQIRKKAKHLVVDWLKTMLVDEEKEKVSVDNIEKYLPEQTHIYMNKCQELKENGLLQMKKHV